MLLLLLLLFLLLLLQLIWLFSLTFLRVFSSIPNVSSLQPFLFNVENICF